MLFLEARVMSNRNLAAAALQIFSVRPHSSQSPARIVEFLRSGCRDLLPGAGDAGNAKSFMSFWRATIASQRTSDIAITRSDWLTRLAPSARPSESEDPVEYHRVRIKPASRLRGNARNLFIATSHRSS